MEKKQHYYLILYLLFLIGIYHGVLSSLVADWWIDPNFSHGFLIVPVSGYLIWKKRHSMKDIEIKGSCYGLIFILLAVLAYWFGEICSLDFADRLSFILWIYGSVVFFFGISMYRVIIFPMFFLLFMIPPPYILYDQISYPLRMLASTIATSSLITLGIPAFQEGNIISLSAMKLDIVDACSGIRSLMTLLALGSLVTYMFNRKIFVRPFVVLSAIPIAILTNSFRIVMTGVIAEMGYTRIAEGFFHNLSGWLLSLLGMSLVLSVGLLCSFMELHILALRENRCAG